MNNAMKTSLADMDEALIRLMEQGKMRAYQETESGEMVELDRDTYSRLTQENRNREDLHFRVVEQQSVVKH